MTYQAGNSAYYAAFYDDKSKGWCFLMPAEHGPPMHKKYMGDILVGPYPEREKAQSQANTTHDACVNHVAVRG